MTWTSLLLVIYCLLVAVCSLFGGWLPGLVRLTHTRMQRLLSFVGGLILGVGVLHLVPHASGTLRSLDLTMRWVVGGILTTFFMIRVFHAHSHGTVDDFTPATSGGCDHPDHDHTHDHDHDSNGLVPLIPVAAIPATSPPGHPHGHSHGHGPHHGSHHGHAHTLPTGRWNWVGLALGLTLHTLIDGLALAASVVAEARHLPGTLGLFGLGTFLAIALHKPLDSLSITSLMTASGWSPRTRGWVNLAYSLMCPLGALIFFFGVSQTTDLQDYFVGISIAFAGGVFICIAAADLLPEIEMHDHNRFELSLLIVLGVFVAYGIGFLEPSHAGHHHGHSH